MENYQFFTLIGLISAGFGWIIIQMLKMQKDYSNKHIELLKEMHSLEIRLSDEIRSLDIRLSHVEGYLMGYNQKTGTENFKEKKQ